MGQSFIPISKVQLGAAEEKRVLEVLRSGHLAQGPVVLELEQRFADVCGVTEAIAVSSGTAALTLAVGALGLGDGDEVITSPFTFVATINAILASGASVRFCDVSPTDFNIDVDRLHEVITPRSRAILPVHLYGQPADMERIEVVARDQSLSIIEDAAQAHGARVGPRAAGSYGVGCFSFYATKNLTTGEGGIVTTDDEAVAHRIRLVRNQGMERRYEYLTQGGNYRLTDIQAAIALPQLDRLDAIVSQRQANAAYLSDRLVHLPGLVVPKVMPGRTHVFHQYTLRVTADATVSRDDLVRHLEAHGIGAGVYYPAPAHHFPCFLEDARVKQDAVPVAERLAGEVVSLPVHPSLTSDELERIVSAVRSAFS